MFRVRLREPRRIKFAFLPQFQLLAERVLRPSQPSLRWKPAQCRVRESQAQNLAG